MALQSCRRCLYAETHPLGITFDEEGICSGCRVHEEKDKLDWAARWRLLEKIVESYRSTSGENYDCVVPVSGAHDSHWIVHLVKERLYLNPLLVTYNKQFNTPLGIRNLANLRIRFNCDILIQNIDQRAIKRITRTALRMFGSMYWHCLAGQSVFPVQTAVRYRIPLIIWGAHQGLEQVGMFSHTHEVEMTRRYRKEHDLMGQEGDGLQSIFNFLADGDVLPFRYPDDADLNAVGVRGIYLGNYVRWDPKAQHEHMIASHGYRTAAFARTFDCYDYVDCYNYMDVHDLLKLYKHGYSKVTDHASREIRYGRLTRAQALNLVRRFELTEPPYLDLFCDWLGIDRRGVQFLMDHHRNPRFWKELSPGKWQFRGWSTLQETAPSGTPSIAFTATGDLECGRSRGYIIVGKGYP